MLYCVYIVIRLLSDMTKHLTKLNITKILMLDWIHQHFLLGSTLTLFFLVLFLISKLS